MMLHSKSEPRRAAQFSWLGVAIFILVTVTVVFSALSVSIDSPTFHLDGAFQTASGLFRLNSGQLPGRDFYPYLGIGPLFVIFPVFKIFGGNLAASVLAAKLLSITVGWLAVALIWHLTLRPKHWAFSLAGGAVLFIGNYLVAKHLTNLPYILDFSFSPGNSLKPIRAALPYLVAIAIYVLIRQDWRQVARNSSLGLVLGVALLWSNDFAVPTFGIFVAFVFGYLRVCERASWLKSGSQVAGVAISTWLALLTAATHGCVIEILRYNFVDVAKDQWWYFAPYGPTSRVFDSIPWFRVSSPRTNLSLIVLLIAAVTAVKAKSLECALLTMIGLALFSGGVLASVGGHFADYFLAFQFWGMATVICLIGKVLLLVSGHRVLSESTRKAILWGCLAIFAVAAGFEWKIFRGNHESASHDAERFYVPELGGFLGRDFGEYVDYARRHRESVVVEDYWGVWSSLNRRFPPWPVDSVIHALGSVRSISKAALDGADMIVTTRNRVSQEWQPWVLSQNFWFYEEVLLRWQPDFISPTTIVWKRSAGKPALEPVKCLISDDQQGIVLSPGLAGYYRVSLSYLSTSTGLGRHLLMFRNNISFGDDAGGFVSLQPGAHDATIPLLVTEADTEGTFSFKVVGNAIVKISGCAADKIRSPNIGFLHAGKS